MLDPLTPSDRKQVAEILKRRVYEIARHHMEYTRDNSHHGSVELALSREIDRLRRLADRVDPEVEEDDDA